MDARIKYTLAKLAHVLIFLVFAALPMWLIVDSWGKHDLSHAVMGLVMATIIALGAKRCFIDGFATVERKRLADTSHS